MKTIQAVKVWFNGAEQEATVLSAIVGSDNLKDSATFNYQLLKNTNIDPVLGSGLIILASGSIYMSGDAYNNWETNDYAYDWIAQQLNLIITGEYVPSII